MFELRTEPEPDKVLRIGFLSPDLRNHPVGYFMEPILRHHWPDRYEVICYSDSAMRDETNGRLRELATGWRDTAGWSDDRVGEAIVADGIDVLVDLTGHTASNRAELLCRRPAPVQALYLGYPSTSGLPTMDFVIGDSIVAPMENGEQFSERVIELDGCFLCFAPQPNTPEVGAPPSVDGGPVTFGNFNTLAKLSSSTVALWSRVLEEVPGSHLMLKNQALMDVGTRELVIERFEREGIDRSRLMLTKPVQPLSAYLAEYRAVDIVLDTVPYCGGTTTCDAIWMGVPVVTQLGGRFSARMGASILTAVGHEDLIAEDDDSFVSIAKVLAEDHGRRQDLRDSLRDSMAKSSLCDVEAFAHRFQDALRLAWRKYCEEKEV
jgi:predicted O-linked N-acetylglucosamine transferase (SPINDLY family)